MERVDVCCKRRHCQTLDSFVTPLCTAQAQFERTMKAATRLVLRGTACCIASAAGGSGSASHLAALPNCALYRFADLAASAFFCRRLIHLPFIAKPLACTLEARFSPQRTTARQLMRTGRNAVTLTEYDERPEAPVSEAKMSQQRMFRPVQGTKLRCERTDELSSAELSARLPRSLCRIQPGQPVMQGVLCIIS